MPRVAARAMAVDRGLPFEVIVGEEVTTLGGHLLALFIERPIRPLPRPADDDRRRPRAGGIAIPAHPLVPFPLCAQGWALRRLLDDPDPAVHPDALEAFNPTALGRPWHDRVVRFADEHGLARVGQQRRPCPGRDRDRLDRVRGPHRRRPADRRSSAGMTTRHGALPRRAGQVGVFGRQSRKRARRRPGRGARPGPPRRDRAATTATRAVGLARRATTAGATTRTGHEDRPRLPVHLPGERRGRPARPVPVREPAPARPRRAHPDRQPRPAALVGGRRHPARRRLLGAGPTARSGRSPSRRATSSQISDMLEREQFDLLHFHEPFVPFLSLFLLRESRSVNIATFHAYAGFSPSYEFGSGRCVATPRGSTAGSPSAPRRATSSTASSRATTRSSPTASTSPGTPTPSRSRAGRTGRRTSCSWAATSRARACWTCSRPTASCARPAPSRACSWSARARRSARRAATSRHAACRASSSSAACRDAEKAQLFGTADVYASPATGGESFGIVLLEAMAAGTPIVCSDIHGYKGVVRRGREGLLVPPREPRELAVAIDRAAARPGLREQMGAAGQARAEEFSWPRVTAKVEEYYGFVIRRLAAAGRPARRTSRADVPQAPPLRARPSARRRPSLSRVGSVPRGSRLPIRRAPAATPRPSRPRPGRSAMIGPGQDGQGRCEQRRIRGASLGVLTGNWNAYR